MRNINLRTLSLALTFFVSSIASTLQADEHAFCPDASLPEEFVKDAIVLCMQDLPSRRSDCMRHAEMQFNQCEMQGNFRRISSRVQTKLIVLSLFKNLVSSPSDRYKVAATNQ